MKHNTMKRVLAATLSVLTVAAPMTANVGGILQEVAIVATAEEGARQTFNWKNTVYDDTKGTTYLTDFSVDGTAMANLTSNESTYVNAGKTVTLKSEVPLTFNLTNDASVEGEVVDKAKEAITAAKTAAEAAINACNEDDLNDPQKAALNTVKSKKAALTELGEVDNLEKAYDAVTKAEEAVQAAKDLIAVLDVEGAELNVDFTDANTALTNADVAIANSANLAKAFKVLAVGDDYGEWNEAKKGFVKDDNDNEIITTESQAKKKLLEKAKYDTKSGTFMDSVFSTDHTKLYVIFNSGETANSDGTYSYSYTMPDTTVELDVIKQKATLSFFKKEEDRHMDDPNTAPEPECVATQWKELKIECRTDAGDTEEIAADNKTKLLEHLVAGDTVTVTCSEPFKVHVSDNNDRNAWDNAKTTYDIEKNQFKATFTMPQSVNANPVTIHIAHIVDTYNYTASGDQLLASSVDTGFIKDEVAASIEARVYSQDDKEDVGNILLEADKDDKGTAVSGEVAYGKFVAIKACYATKLVNGEPAAKVVIKKDGTTLTDAQLKEITKGDEENNYYVINGTAAKGDAAAYTGAGTYTVTYSIKGVDGKTYSITKTITIGAKGELTAENVKLTVTAKANNVAVGNPHTLFKGQAVGSNEANAESGKTASFMLGSEEITNTVRTAGYQFTVEPTIYTGFTDDGGFENTTALRYGVSYTVEEDASGSTLDHPYTFLIKITDPEWGGSATNPKIIPITWEVKAYVEDPVWRNSVPNDGQDNGDHNGIDVSIEDMEDMKSKIFHEAAVNNVALALEDEVEYKWIKGEGAILTGELQDELDRKKPGLPTNIGTNTVYVYYQGKVVSTVQVRVSQYAMHIEADEADLSMTYGDAFALNKYTLLDSSNTELKDVSVSDIKVSYVRLADAEAEPVAPDNENDPDLGGWSYTHVIAALNDRAENKPADEVGQLDAGIYAVVFTAKSSDEDYAVVGVPQIMNIARKDISDPSVVILINPIKYDGKQHDIVQEGDNKFTVRDTDFEPGDLRYNISAKFKITEGSKKTLVGKYDCTYKLIDNDPNYKGKATATWSITAKEKAATEATPGLTWIDDKSTIYESGRIHVEVKRNANDKIMTNGKDAEIVKYGVIYDKSGKIAAPANYDDYTADGADDVAESHLQLGNGFLEACFEETAKNGMPAAGSTQDFKGNIKIEDVKIGIWCRPFIQYKDGEVSYGDVKYLDMTTEALRKLNVQMPIANNANVANGSKAVRKATLTANQTVDLETTLTYVRGGYIPEMNKFYAYASFIDLKTAGFSDTVSVRDFGLIVEKNGVIEAPGADYAAAKANAKKKLDVNTKGAIVGHYDKNNSKLGENEFAATIKVANTATGCWVRPYVDLGNDLVVYGEPEYIASPSEYYADAIANLNCTAKWIDDKHSRLEFVAGATANATKGAIAGRSGVAANKIKVVQTGVIADSDNMLKKPTMDFEYGAVPQVMPVLNPNAPFNRDMLLGTDYIQGIKDDNFNDRYVGRLTPQGTNDVSVRSYVVYDINGVTVPLYGTVKTYEYSPRVKRVVEERKFSNLTGDEDDPKKEIDVKEDI